MVKIILFLLILIGIGISVSLLGTAQTSVVTQKTADYAPIDMQAGVFEDSHCGMLIHDLTDAAQVIFPDQAVFFSMTTAAWQNGYTHSTTSTKPLFGCARATPCGL